MIESLVVDERPQTIGEEIANSVSHGLGMLAAIAGAPILIIFAVQDGGAANIVGSSVFAGTMILLYMTSTLYHALPKSRTKQVFQLLDHGAIFLLIAGTYTPFTLGVLRGGWGWTLFGLIWSLALAGIILKVVCGAKYPKLSMILYLTMGWIVVIAVKMLWLNISVWGLFWLLAGGIAYTVGVVFFMIDEKVRYSHFIWHLFVIAGTSCHFVAVLWYSINKTAAG
jgi:hemolysin III